MEPPPPPPSLPPLLPPLQQQEHHPSLPELNLENLKAIKVLGKGAMGTVFLVHDRAADAGAKNPYALKVVDKTTLNTKFEAERRARWEIQVLKKLSGDNSHPFLPHLISSSETSEFLAWAVPYCPGGDLNVLRYHQNDRVFSSAVVRFYLAEIVCAVEHLHEMGIVYRDLKPENILIQQSGHVTLTDFDLSRTLNKPTVKSILSSSTSAHHNLPLEKKPSSVHHRNLTRWLPMIPVSDKTGLRKAKSARVSPVSRKKLSFTNGERSNSFVGTEEYVSPEIIRGEGHEFSVDWWAFGILTYEMLYGTTPFKGTNRKETFRNILYKKPEFVGKRNELTDLIERLLEKDPTKRLGYQRGACEIKEHVFFKGVTWDLLTEVLRPPYIPARDDVNNLTEKVTSGGGGIDIREYFQDLRKPPSLPPSPLPSPSSDCQKKMWVEF
ncbi:serine/threonine-protein kinase UCNL [Mercurialis annua]|uniref:serine/threonine-protein kinase UCNL n=1 Tax=Mercurialis annua TaxID=3986 RepID=UPI002160A4C2|nr:serine/threonine-protein kinase UCNL [Mercurialis annua]